MALSVTLPPEHVEPELRLGPVVGKAFTVRVREAVAEHPLVVTVTV